MAMTDSDLLSIEGREPRSREYACVIGGCRHHRDGDRRIWSETPHPLCPQHGISMERADTA